MSVKQPLRRSHRIRGLSPEHPSNPTTQSLMEQEMHVNLDVGSGSLLELEGVLVTEEGGEFSLPSNVPITNYSFPLIEKQPSS